MSTLYLGTDADLLANRLARHLDQSARQRDFFAPTTVVVPHRSLAKWLKLWLARHQGIAANLRVLYFEAALWEMLRQIDPRPQDPAPELLDVDSYRLLVLSILQENREPGLDYWQSYLDGASPSPQPLAQGERGPRSRLYCRRLWQLADQLAVLVRDYEYHRQDALIQPWLKGELGLDESHERLERAQQAIFRAITREPDGKRARLNQAWRRNFKTLPQYAMEVMEHFTLHKLPCPEAPRETLHLFGLAQFSTLHATVLRWLGRFFDVHLYHTNALASRLPSRSRGAMQKLARKVLHPNPEDEAVVGLELLRAWGQAGAESLANMSQLLLDPKAFQAELLLPPRREITAEMASLYDTSQGTTVLSRLQDQLLRGVEGLKRLSQDVSLQIVACPGMVREVETVYDSILANLQKQPDLKQSDVAVFVTDMDRYRPLLQGVFERQPRRLRYNLSAFTAAGVSTFAQGFVGMLDLDAFSRTQVFAVLLNPCFLARLGVDRAQALVWLDWAEALGIYQGWDQGDKKERGYAESPLFAWRLGLQRLRLGRIMEAGRDDGGEPLARFGPVVPYADLHSGDPEQLNTFCLAVEGLLPRLARLRTFRGSAAQWVARLEQLMHDFLQVPEDRPEEAQVWDRLLAAMKKWLLWDHLGEEKQQLTLPLVREMVVSLLEGIEGTQGEFLAGGVTIAALQLFKPVPFRIVYILGLCEDYFPGNNALSGLDLRGVQRLPGDIRPAEYHRYLLLEALLSARDRIYLLYHNLEAQKDQELHPCVPLQQLKRYLRDNVLQGEFAESKVPLVTADERFLREDEGGRADVLVHHDDVDRLLALESGQRHGLMLTPEQQTEFEARLRDRSAQFTLAEGTVPLARSVPTLSLRDLKKYLEFPVPAALKYHFRLEEDDDDEPSDSEPFVSDGLVASRLMQQSLNQVVLQAVRTDVQTAVKDWPARFERVYQDWSLRGQLPEEAFGEVDRAALQEDLRVRIDGSGGLDQFLEQRPGKTFCGPVLLGESATPVGAQQRFPALVLPLSRPLPQLQGGEVRLVGAVPLAWRDENAFEVLVWNFRKVAKNGKPPDRDLFKFLLEPVLFYLALRAGSEGAPTSRAWLGERAFRVHIAHVRGIFSYEYAAKDINPEEALAYLAELATDFLDPDCFDLLPLEKIMDKTFQEAFTVPDDELGDRAEEYPQLLEEALADDLDSPWTHWMSPLIDLVQPTVPVDAFAKVRRRFRIIDQGPRRQRELERVAGKKKRR